MSQLLQTGGVGTPKQHARLLSQLKSEADAGWSTTALIACLEQLRTSNVTEAGQVAVLDAWVDGADAFCVVYQSPYEDGRSRHQTHC